MICLTGDVHHSSLKINEHLYMESPERAPEITLRYVKLAQKYGLKVTLYVTGKTFKEDWPNFKPVTEADNVEIGGHSYAGLPNNFFRKMFYRMMGQCPPSNAKGHGSRAAQKKDILKMISIVKERTGRDIVSWRSHGYVADKNTYPLLAECGIKFISDETTTMKTHPEKTPEGLISHPLNVIPDHDHIYHAHRDRKFVENAKARGYGHDAFGNDSYPIEEWGRIVEKQVRDIQQKGGVATILMEPVCQFTSDDMKTAERLFEFFSQYENIWANEAAMYLTQA
jgi:hypothetical protein